jgi:type I restriction enzyme S subunit
MREAEELHGDLRSLSHDLKRAAMEQVFRCGLSGDAQVESSIGLVPEGWVVEDLDENHTVQTGGTPARGNASYWEGGTIPWVKTAEVSYTTIVDTSEHITESALAETTVKLFPVGTVLLAMYGQGVTRGKVAKLGVDATCNQACAAIRSPEGVIDPDYLYYFLEWQYESIRSRAHGGQQQNLSLDIVRKIPIAYPADHAQQRQIASLLKSIDDKVGLHRDRTRVVQELFQRLLHDLMTGAISSEELTLRSVSSNAESAT